jgi:peptidoglycan/LPS O-acetylase OafA/YrhL
MTQRLRIAPLDGLRSVAVLGVIWAHCWLFTGNPGLFAFGVNFNKVIAILGNGVDLFFVISGFCMELMYANSKGFAGFLRRRWLRIAPAFYVAGLATASYVWATTGLLEWRCLVEHLFFVHTVVPGAQVLASPFWSLATEWHFYMLLPPLAWLARRLGPFGWRLLLACSVG